MKNAIKTCRRRLPVTCWIPLLIVSFTSAAAPVNDDAGTNLKMPIGLQLYSLRDDLGKDVPGTLAKVRGYGFHDVELAGTYGVTPEKFKQLLVENNLQAIGGHFSYEQYRDNPEGVAREAETLGLKYAGCAWIPHDGDFKEADCRAAIETFNRASTVLARHGLKFYYHPHGYEFQPYGNGTLFDLLVSETNPKTVLYEMDVFWIVFPAQDPVKLLNKYRGRWVMMHLKDLKKGVATGALTAKTDVANDVVLGTGQMDWPAVLRAAKKAGVKYYFIEDESPSSATQIPQSLNYLKTLK